MGVASGSVDNAVIVIVNLAFLVPLLLLGLAHIS